MSGTKVSQLGVASSPADADLLYLVNGGNPRNFSLVALLTWLKSKGVPVSVNAQSVTDGALVLTKTDLGLDNVTNVKGTTTTNGLEGDVVIDGVAGVTVTPNGSTNHLTIDPSGISIPFTQLTGVPTDNSALASVLASVGVQIPVRTVNSGSGVNLAITDVQRPWVDADFVGDTQLKIPDTVNAPVGAVIEIRQAGVGKITLTGDVFTIVNVRFGTVFSTNGQGTRIQVVSLGGQAWEFR